MRSPILALLLVAAASCHAAAPPSSPFDAAEAAAEQRQFLEARDLYREAARSESDPERRAIALARVANIEWRVMRDLAAARATLANAAEPQTLIERSRAEGELAHDWTAAHAFAVRAVAAAKKRDDRRRAMLTEAATLVRPVRDARLERRCVSADSLAPAIATLRAVIERDGPLLGASRLLLDAAIVAGDRATMLQAWQWYYGSVPPGVPADRRGLGLALAKAKFFDEAALVLGDPCAAEPLTDAESRDAVFYAAALRRIRDVADEHYRRVALGENDDRGFGQALDREGEALWQRFGSGDYSREALMKALFARFGAIATFGKTGGVQDIHLGHAVIDTARTVTQYGRSANIRFVALDGMVSNGYSTWASDGAQGDGGWNNAQGIFQVRPMYADGPIGDWRVATDAEVRAERERELADETKRDEARDPLTAPRGTAMRLRLQADDALLAELKAKGLTGDALRSAFLDRVRDDVFNSSILAHEGRHAIDAKEGIKDAAQLEYDAKLSEVAFAPSPRRAVIGGILVNLDASSPHGKANRRIFEGVTAWMKGHAAGIAGLDASKPLLAQLDKLTDDQLRAAFRSLDPLAKE